MSPSSLVLLLVLTAAPLTVRSASLRDYVNSAAHYVGMDSLVSSVAAPAGPLCCDPVPTPAPCLVEKKVIPAPTPAPCPPPVVVKQAPAPCANPCPIDYERANAASHSKMWEVAMKGKALAGTLTNALAAPVVFTNDKIAAGASMLPGLLAAKGSLMGQIMSAPVQFMTAKSSLLAKGTAGVIVGVPVALGTGVAAGVSGLMEKVADINRQEQECLCARAKKDKEGKKEEKKDSVPCPCASPSLVAAGSGNEEVFSIRDPVTDSPVTEAVTDAIGAFQADAREFVTDSSFTTTTSPAGEEDKTMMGMPGRAL